MHCWLLGLPHLLPICFAVQALHLQEMQERPWQIAPTNGLTGEGLDKAMEWLADKLLRS
jgi:ADP-ribosylation factor-like protein 6